MKYLNRYVGHRVLVQLEHADGPTFDGILDAATREHIELVDVTVRTMASNEGRAADGRMIVPALSVAWVQLP